MKTRDNSILPLTPNADHTGKDGYFVNLDANGQAALVSSASDIPFGLILEGLSTDDTDSIAVPGGFAGTASVKLSASASPVSAGAYLVLTADGSVEQEQTGAGARVRVAKALESGTADELIEAVLIEPLALS